MDQREAMRAVFDTVADTYDDVGIPFFGPVAERLVEELAPEPGARAVDIGCGRGAVLVPLARAAGPDGSVVGLDISPRMVDQARAAVAAAGLAADVRVGDAEAPDLPAGSFDVVASSLVVFFLPDPAKALRAWLELLTPGGRLGLATFGPFTDSWHTVEEVFTPYLPPQLRDARTSGAQGPFASDAGVEGLLAEAGYADVRTSTFTLPVRFDDAAQWYRWSMSVAQRAWWERMPDDERAGVRAAAAAAMEQTRAADGRMGFDQVVRLTFGRRP